MRQPCRAHEGMRHPVLRSDHEQRLSGVLRGHHRPVGRNPARLDVPELGQQRRRSLVHHRPAPEQVRPLLARRQTAACHLQGRDQLCEQWRCFRVAGRVHERPDGSGAHRQPLDIRRRRRRGAALAEHCRQRWMPGQRPPEFDDVRAVLGRQRILRDVGCQLRNGNVQRVGDLRQYRQPIHRPRTAFNLRHPALRTADQLPQRYLRQAAPLPVERQSLTNCGRPGHRVPAGRPFAGPGVTNSTRAGADRYCPRSARNRFTWTWSSCASNAARSAYTS